MAIVSPTTNPMFAYRPIVFTASRASANPLVWAYVTATINGTTYAAFPVPMDNESPAGTYNFVIDLQGMVQDVLTPKSNVFADVWGTINLPYQNQSTDTRAEFDIDVTYSYIDPATGLLTDLGVTDMSTTCYALSAAAQHEEDFDFNDYKPQAASPNSKKWLTYAPTTLEVANTENLWLCHIADAAADRYRVRTYDSSGVLIDTGDFAADTSAGENAINSVGVGIANLATQVYLVGAVTLPNPSAAYYTITIWNSAAPFIEFIEIRRFNIVGYCDNSVRVHWFNTLGGTDAYTFKNLQKKQTSISGNTAQRPLNLASHNLYDKGTYKLSTTAKTQYEAISSPLSATDAYWLMGLATSVETYRETTAGLIPIVVTAEVMPIEDNTPNQLNLVQVKITFEDSNALIIQHM